MKHVLSQLPRTLTTFFFWSFWLRLVFRTLAVHVQITRVRFKLQRNNFCIILISASWTAAFANLNEFRLRGTRRACTQKKTTATTKHQPNNNTKQTNKQTNKQTKKQNKQTNKQTNEQTNKQTEKIRDLSPVQLTVSNCSQSSGDSVSLFAQ